jgi:hypothetical protein
VSEEQKRLNPLQIRLIPIWRKIEARPGIALVVILFLTALLWIGVSAVSFATDDYQYLHGIAPISGIGAIFAPFARADPNQSFFRPLANATMAIDFLVYGWNGGAHHITNLFFHLAVTLLLYFACRRIFLLKLWEALLATFIFGTLGSHDPNLLLITARADLLSTFFVLAALMFERESREEKDGQLLWRILGVLSFLLGLASKEIAVMVIPLIIFLFDLKPGQFNRKGIMNAIENIAPYVVVLVPFYLYRTNYTASIFASQPIQSEGMSSPFAFLRNGAYGAAYLLFPLDLKTATSILNHAKMPALALAGVFACGLVWILTRKSVRSELKQLYAPLVFTFFTGFIVLQSFERWRLYMPSVGAVVLIVLVLKILWCEPAHRNTVMRYALLLMFGAWMLFQWNHAWRAERNLQANSALLGRLKNNLGALLSERPQRPLYVQFVTVPAKLGSSSVMQLGVEDLLKQAELERLGGADYKLASIANEKLEAQVAVEIYALDAARGYQDVKIDELTPRSFMVSVPKGSATNIIPSMGFTAGVARRDWELRQGDTLRLPGVRVTLVEAEGPVASKLAVDLTDSMFTPMIFDVDRFRFANTK